MANVARVLRRFWRNHTGHKALHVGQWRRRRDGSVLPPAFGLGSRRTFRSYLEGRSTVRVESLRDVFCWLRECEYITDQDRVGKSDQWQHPSDFERSRKGDCEDHAIWAWRQLGHLGIYATLVGGDLESRSHVWVMYADDHGLYLLEATTKAGSMALPAAEAAIRYCPRYGVDTGLRVYRYDAWFEAPSRATRA